MSASIAEVIQSGGYDLSTVEDARWLVGQVSQFEELVVAAEDLIEESEAQDE